MSLFDLKKQTNLKSHHHYNEYEWEFFIKVKAGDTFTMVGVHQAYDDLQKCSSYTEDEKNFLKGYRRVFNGDNL